MNGWTITDPLPDMDDVGRAFIDYAEIAELPRGAWDAVEQPTRDLAEYKYPLGRARRRAARERLRQLVTAIDVELQQLLMNVPRNSTVVLTGPVADELRSTVGEIERLIADTVERRGRLGDLHRHLHFGEGHDWHDINEFDWPTVKPDIEAGAFTDVDPLPVPEIDIGEAAADTFVGAVTVG